MSNEDWRDSWRRNDIEFHQAGGNGLLRRFWPDLDLPAGAPILVPLCGKSRDLVWLAAQGHPVLGVELSPIAITALFKESGLTPTRRKEGRFMAWRHGNLTILCGDFFALNPAHVAGIAVVYDRTSLTALPEATRRDYAAHMIRILPKASDAALARLLQSAHTVDGIVKGLKQPDWPPDGWQALQRLAFQVCRVKGAAR